MVRSLRLIGAAVLAMALGCSPEAVGPDASTVPPALTVQKVTTIQAVRGPLRRTSEQPGQVEPIEEAPLYAKVSGYVETVAVDIGDPVKKGQLLVALRVPELEDALRRSEAEVARALAEVKQAEAAIKVARAKEATAEAGLVAANASGKRSQAMAALGREELSRIGSLARSGAVTSGRLDESRNASRAAAAGEAEADALANSAKAAISEAKGGAEKALADRDAIQARAMVAQAQRDEAKTMLAYGRVLAPFGGTVTARNVHPGHMATAGNVGPPLVTVTRLDVVRIVVDVPEADASFVEKGDPAVVVVPALPGAKFAGTIARSRGSLDRATRTLRAEIEVPNPQGKLIPGTYVNASLVVAEKEGALTLPLASVMGVAEGTAAVLIVEGGKIVRRPVELGLSGPFHN